ncbi:MULTISPECIES: GPP34 family phosphoprotein [unclassified Streptomyces]|uniref:GPP34 family phosphoprotein n=1 Tax=unclassified Streptomyces TaxID=2593676 RepID=UPI0036FC3057
MATGRRTAPGDRLLARALASAVAGGPGETVRDWLWRRGEELAAAYALELQRAGPTARPRGYGPLPRSVPTAPADPPEYFRARERLASGDPVLMTLAAVLAIGGLPPDTGGGNGPDGYGPDGYGPDGDDAVATVPAAVGEAVTEPEAVRLRRSVETDAFDNTWRG